MAQLLISHKFQSGLHSHMKPYQTRSTRLELAYKFSTESDQKYGNARCFKKRCLKIKAK